MNTIVNEAMEGQKTLIDKYEEDYKSALNSIDNDVKDLIESGKEMKSLILMGEKISIILEVHEALHNFYSLIYSYQAVLTQFNSERLRQLGHEPKSTVKLLQSSGEWFDTSEEVLEHYVLSELETVGFKKTHWFIKSRILTEIEYMIDTLRILVEPDYIPLDDNFDEESNDKSERYVSPVVKLAVWRRDHGKCIECGSKEKLEYDHIVPVSKGGSNTEINIQLLCEKCNRKKSPTIQ